MRCTRNQKKISCFDDSLRFQTPQNSRCLKLLFKVLVLFLTQTDPVGNFKFQKGLLLATYIVSRDYIYFSPCGYS